MNALISAQRGNGRAVTTLRSAPRSWLRAITPIPLRRAGLARAVAMEDHGWKTVEVPGADDCPDAVFVEDTMVVFRNVAVISRPGADSRKPEIIEAEKVIEDLGLSINRIRPPGTLDGGDVLKVGDTVYVGRGGRTNAEGIRQLRAILEPLGANVIAVTLTKVLHLKSAVMALPDGTIVGHPPLVDDPACSIGSSPCPRSPAPTSCCSAERSCSSPRTVRRPMPCTPSWATSP